MDTPIRGRVVDASGNPTTNEAEVAVDAKGHVQLVPATSASGGNGNTQITATSGGTATAIGPSGSFPNGLVIANDSDSAGAVWIGWTSAVTDRTGTTKGFRLDVGQSLATNCPDPSKLFAVISSGQGSTYVSYVAQS